MTLGMKGAQRRLEIGHKSWPHILIWQGMGRVGVAYYDSSRLRAQGSGHIAQGTCALRILSLTLSSYPPPCSCCHAASQGLFETPLGWSQCTCALVMKAALDH